MRGRSNTKSDQQRFLEKVLKTDSCWTWQGGTSNGGYGAFWLGNRLVGAHKAAFMLFSGQVPAGTDVCHSCDQPSCVNPQHLFLGTRSQNMLDASAKKRLNSWKSKVTQCPKGHEYSPSNTRLKGKRRICRACSSEQMKSYRRNLRGQDKCKEEEKS